MENADSVVIDTSAFYALASDNDRYHDKAFELFESLVSDEVLLCTTSYALVETHALVSRRLGFAAVRRFVEVIGDQMEIVWVDRVLHEEAWTRLLEAGGTGLNLVDWTLALTAQERSATLFSFDSDFRGAGMLVIPAL